MGASLPVAVQRPTYPPSPGSGVTQAPSSPPSPQEPGCGELPALGTLQPLHLLSSPEDLGGDDKAGPSAGQRRGRGLLDLAGSCCPPPALT